MKILWTSCADCNCGQLQRITRRFWMRLLPFTRHYYCHQCHRRVFAPTQPVGALGLARRGPGGPTTDGNGQAVVLFLDSTRTPLK